MRKITLFVLIFLLLGCDKPNPEPEKLDPIFSEIEKEINSKESEIKSAEKDLEGFEKDMKAVVPQTGQVKYAQKRLDETNSKIEKLKQMKSYWEIRLESRKKWAREHYLMAYKKKEPWPDPKEIEEYELQRKLEQAPKNWDAKARLEQSKIGIPVKVGEAGHGEAQETKSEHGEH